MIIFKRLHEIFLQWAAEREQRQHLKDARKLFGDVPFITEEESLAEDVAELNRQNPGWDEEMRVRNAQNCLTNKRYSLEDATAIFGEKTALEAQRRLDSQENDTNRAPAP